MTRRDTKQLDNAIALLYAGSLENFVRNRESLAKELRTAGKTEAAAEVKTLKKPSRTAWALNVAAGQREIVRRLDEAIVANLRAQKAGGDVRAASGSLRDAVREFADHAGSAAKRAGNDIPSGELVNAVLALIGRTEALDALRRSRLVDVPEGGGLDFLAALPRSLPVPKPPSTKTSAAPSAARIAARARAERARETLRDAESKLRAAEARLRAAEVEVEVARREVDRARRHAQ